ncbi:hypothetical protein OEA41_001715 [Lepraria neglecta]|uniref:Acyl-CoA thioesterase II n=1 Tax=Lepraria neglecta TaxID=209136 RepID=A0AAD9ZA41_9LECA|nr:hypothetical protein OEA41_001715 [Lepraria neglecta]
MPGATLVRPPPVDPSKSPMETVLELRTLSDIGPDIFTNARELWHPPGARGLYGGAVISQCLAAAQETVPSPSPENNRAVFLIHSMHCYFVLAGDASIPILYHVERVRDGKSFLTRTVQARQRGKCIFTTTLSFMRENSGDESTVDHGWDMPEGAREGLDKILRGQVDGDDEDAGPNGVESRGPFISKILGIADNHSPYPHQRKPEAWVKCRGSISPSGGQHAHLAALAYMSDSWFIGTVSRVHGISRAGAHLYNEIFPPTTRYSSGQAEASKNTLRTPEGARVGMMMQTPWSGQGRGLVEQRIWNKDGRTMY